MLRHARMGLCLGLAACANEPEISPLEGPGWDTDAQRATMSAAGDYVVGLTFLQVKNAPGPGGRFGEHADAVGNHLFETEPEGFVGASFRNVGRLNWWTMTVWTSEEAMLDWVWSGPHADAIAAFPDVAARAKKTVLRVPAEDLPLSWDDALEEIDAQDWYTYGVD